MHVGRSAQQVPQRQHMATAYGPRSGAIADHAARLRAGPMTAGSARLPGRSLQDRLGLPDLASQRSLAASLVVDSLGDGLFVPFAIVYFLHTTHLSLQSVGLGLTLAGLLAMPVVLPAGILLDRFAAARVVVAANLLSGVAFVGYLLVGHAWQLVVFALLAGIGGRVYWTANLALVADAFGTDRTRWFAFQRALRNTGFGLGGLLGAAAVSSGSSAGYRALALVNAASYLAAAYLVWRWSRRRQQATARTATGTASPARPTAAHPPATARARYRAVLRDAPFMLVTATNLLFVLCMLTLDVLLAVDLVRALHQPAWLAGVLFAASTAIVAAGQTALSRAVARLRPGRILQLAAAAWSAAFLAFWLAGLLPRTAVVGCLFVAVIVFTLAEMIQGPALNDLVVALAPDHLRGRYLGVYQLSWALGRATAPALLSWLFAIRAGLPWIALATASATCAVTFNWLCRYLQPAQPEH
jgi:MFS family permease